jgi:torulene dioxygenase
MQDYSFLDAARIPNLRAHMGQPNKTAKHDIPGTFRRYRLPKYANATRCPNGTIETRPAVLDFEIPYKTGNIELPRINQAYHGKPYRYA